MRIKDISKENRPRERFLKNGAMALSDAELLAIILQKGSKKENVVDMSNRIISKNGIDKLSELSLKELQEIDGIGPGKAMQIKALFEFNKRYSLSKQNGKPIKSAKDVFEYCSPKLSGVDKEHFIILHLDTRNRVIKDEIVSVGTLNSSVIHPREVFKSAIKESANAIILVHNHPSGDTKPSEEDKTITERLFDAGELLDIKVLDHIIIGNDCYYSFKEKN
ncbi:MAG: DNA repair protein RadC [Nanoarchaeota archaeon]|nr:DNA repair protein RadC [Nanoarchaeota archaeon]MBU1269632.1 DNA repair protein RadC [Nanoarchaeota archaeon]MBU1603716.1 DNA repair protein RadC [Nanoarchaeota archaeon]MBU2442740.1 DNA repair protein RadC [Nanoarchaeota archaeon]